MARNVSLVIQKGAELRLVLGVCQVQVLLNTVELQELWFFNPYKNYPGWILSSSFVRFSGGGHHRVLRARHDSLRTVRAFVLKFFEETENVSSSARKGHWSHAYLLGLVATSLFVCSLNKFVRREWWCIFTQLRQPVILARVTTFQLLVWKSLLLDLSKGNLHWQKLLTSEVCVRRPWKSCRRVLVTWLSFLIFSLKNFARRISRSRSRNHRKLASLDSFLSRVTVHSIVKILLVLPRLVKDQYMLLHWVHDEFIGSGALVEYRLGLV